MAIRLTRAPLIFQAARETMPTATSAPNATLTKGTFVMPLARIDVPLGFPAEARAIMGQVVYASMRATLNVPEGDHFQIITEHSPISLVADPNYLEISRSKDVVFIQVTLNEGRALEAKKAFFKAIADGLHERVHVRPEDVLISLVETKKENWSFGNGEAQYA